MVNLGHRANRRFASTARDALLDCNTRWQSAHQIDVRFFELLHELPRIRRHAVEKTALPFGKQNVERERRFPGATESGDHYQLLPRNCDMNVLEIVLSRAVNLDRTILLRVEERTRLACSVRRLSERFFGGT